MDREEQQIKAAIRKLELGNELTSEDLTDMLKLLGLGTRRKPVRVAKSNKPRRGVGSY